MENKVLLYDISGKKVGETFMRRARQLVKQQRAMWMDDGQTAVQFITDVNTKEIMDDAEISPLPVFDDEAWMIDLANKRIIQRRVYITHSVAFAIGTIPLSFAISLAADNSYWFMMAMAITATSSWFLGFMAHTIVFAVKMHRVRRPDEASGQQRAIEREIANIKRQLDR